MYFIGKINIKQVTKIGHFTNEIDFLFSKNTYLCIENDRNNDDADDKVRQPKEKHKKRTTKTTDRPKQWQTNRVNCE